MYNIVIRQKSKIWSVWGYLYKHSQNSYCISIFSMQQSHFNFRASQGFTKIRCVKMWGVGGARGSYLACGLICIIHEYVIIYKLPNNKHIIYDNISHCGVKLSRKLCSLFTCIHEGIISRRYFTAGWFMTTLWFVPLHCSPWMATNWY